MHLFGRVREPDEMAGIWRQLYLTRASDEMVHKMGQDGGLVSAMLIWLREHDYIDAALVSGVEDDDAWKAKPAVVSTKEEILATAGSRYTYCANPLALPEAKEKGYERLALVGMGCQTSSPPVMWDRKAGKVSKPFLFNIGLLCSKTFDDAIFPELFEAKYGLKKQDMVKMNIKGVFQIWMKDGSYHEIDLKECHGWTRKGCTSCPDFAAEHSDVATGGIGEDNDWTLTIVRTELGEEVIERMIADGSIIAKPAQSDETAMRLLRLLSIVSRRRWPEFADTAPAVGVPPPKKKAAAPGPGRAPAPDRLQPLHHRLRQEFRAQGPNCLVANVDFGSRNRARSGRWAYGRQDSSSAWSLSSSALAAALAASSPILGVVADLLEFVLAVRVDLLEHAVALLVGLGERVDQVFRDALRARVSTSRR